MNVEIKNRPELRAAAVRHVGPYHQIGEAFRTLDSIVRPSGLMKPGAQMIAIYHDTPDSTPTDQLRSDAAVTVSPGDQLPKGLTEERVPGGRYACAIHVGPYEQLGDAWVRLRREWLPASGHRAGSGASYEVYLNNPMTEPDKQKLKTEICFPLAPGA